MVSRLPWCLAAGYAVVALLRYASTPRKPATPPSKARPVVPDAAEPTGGHAPTPRNVEGSLLGCCSRGVVRAPRVRQGPRSTRRTRRAGLHSLGRRPRIDQAAFRHRGAAAPWGP